MEKLFASNIASIFWDELMPTGCLVASLYPTFAIIQANHELVSMLGYSDIEDMNAAAQGSMLSFVHPLDLERVLKVAPSRTDKFDTFRISYRMLCKNGSYRWVEQKSKHFIDQDGAELIAATYMDVTENRSYMQAFKEYVDALPGGVFRYRADKETQIDYVSSHFYDVLGYTKAEFEAKFHNKFSELIYYKDRERVLKEIDDQIQGSDYDTCEYRIEKKDGSLMWVRDDGHIVMGDDGQLYFYVVVLDITASLLLQTALDEAKKANSAKSDFLSRMSHDIRTPMNAIIGLTSLALDEPRLSPAIEGYLSKIAYSSQILLGLINDILDVSKIENGNLTLTPTRYEFKEFCQVIQTMIEPLCRQKNINFIFDSGSTGLAILADRVRFNQVFINLLSNAVKYTPCGGTVELIVTNNTIQDDILSCDFIIRDNGIGMTREFMQRMFEPFSQENRSVTTEFTGTGLGLTIVKSLVELMNGTLHVESILGHGTTVLLHLSLPIDTSAPAQTQTDASNDDAIFLSKTVLLVEDHPLNAEIGKKLLEKRKMIVLTARNGQEGLDVFASAKPGSIDAILMDIRMPLMDGLTATKFIRALARPDARTVPIIAMTANAFDEDRQNSLAAGMTDHLSKPILPNILYETLAKYLR